MGAAMRARVIAALLIALGVLLAQWLALPYLATKRLFLLPTTKLYLTEDGTLTEEFNSIGLRMILNPEPSLRAATLKRYERTDASLPTRRPPVWTAKPNGYPTEAEVSSVIAQGWPFPMARIGWIKVPKDDATQSQSSAPEMNFEEFGNSFSLPWAKLASDPIWRGLAINLAFWWLLAFGVLSIPLRPWLRRRKGRCPKCAYDLKRDFESGCPECGWGRGPQPALSVIESEGVLAEKDS